MKMREEKTLGSRNIRKHLKKAMDYERCYQQALYGFLLPLSHTIVRGNVKAS